MRGETSRPTGIPAGVPYGAAITSQALFDLGLVGAYRTHCKLLVPEFEMKWDHLAPTADHENWQAMDRLLGFADSIGAGMRGHTLWWHGAIPAWVEPEAGNFATLALSHLETTVRRLAGRMHSWDVINEVLAPEDGRPDGLRNTPFLRAFGPGLIREAFHRAAEMDGARQAMLVLNETGLEYGGSAAETKRRCMLRLLERELAAGTPIGCLGLQSHLDAMDNPGGGAEFRAFLREVADLGMPIMITELDVSDTGCPNDIAVRDRIVADAYRAFLDTVIVQAAPLAVVTWGLSDRQSWLAHARPRADGAPVRPLPLDSKLGSKMAMTALQDALRS